MACFEAGYEAGSKEGYDTGHEAGHEAGREVGQKTGHQAGFSAGQEAGWSAGEQAGHAEGLAAGQAAAQRDAEQAMQQARALLAEQADARARAFEHLLAGLQAQIDQRLEQAEDDMIALCFQALCQIVGADAASAAQVRGQVRTALRQAPPSQTMQVHLHPHDLQLLVQEQTETCTPGAGEAVQEIKLNDGSLVGITLRADPSLLHGGCLIVSSEGALDARLDRQFDQLRNTLLRTHGARP